MLLQMFSVYQLKDFPLIKREDPYRYSTQEMQEKFSMTLSAIYTFAHKNAIPKKKEGIMVYYSKKHVDIAKGIAKAVRAAASNAHPRLCATRKG